MLLYVLPQKNKIALTFDDGPNPEYTEKFLNTLKTENVPATFFVVGERARRRPDIIAKIHAQGHTIGNHGLSHSTLKGLSKTVIEEELQTTQEILTKITGTSPTLFRPPRGRFNGKIFIACRKCNLHMVLWSVSAQDSGGIPDQAVIRNLKLNQLHGQEILLMHDNNIGTLTALPKIIRLLREKGFEFTSGFPEIT